MQFSPLDLLWVVIAVLTLSLAVFSSGHALLFKRDPRSAFGWIFICLLLPILGALLYWIFGVNRVETKGQRLHPPLPMPDNSDLEDPEVLEAWPTEHISFSRFGRTVTHRRLEPGNKVILLSNGEEAYPEMLAAISRAKRSILLSTYIFDTDEIGMRFVDALADATRRGVDVKVLVDGMGEKYSRPRITSVLRDKGVRSARFLPWSLMNLNLDVNLRNHRKILVVDGEVCFTGGMNIGHRHMAEAEENPKKALDLHFKVHGPVVADFEQVFMGDWLFATGETSGSPSSSPSPAGDLFARIIIDGPSKEIEKLQWMYIGAINAARKSIRIMTPYFIPSRELIAVLGAAAMREVRVEIVLPEQTNLPMVTWATRAMLWQVLERGVHVFLQPPPFNHAKIFIVDEEYAIVGSGNFDVRSLRLNFELNLEVYGESFASTLIEYFDEAKLNARQTSLAEMDGRTLPVRLRDGAARLFAPML